MNRCREPPSRNGGDGGMSHSLPRRGDRRRSIVPALSGPKKASGANLLRWNAPHMNEEWFMRTLASRTLIALMAIGGSLIAVRAETCLSPFVKRLDRPEKFL